MSPPDGDPAMGEAPSTPASGAAARGRLSLPPRGDRAARRYTAMGVAFYLAAGASLIGALLVRSHRAPGTELRELLGLGRETNLSLFGLIALGIAIVGLALRSVWRDARELSGEEDDVDWVSAHGRDGLELVFAPGDRREALYRRGIREYGAEAGGHVETLMDDRVRRVIDKAGNAYVRVSPEELRAIAETRTWRLGAFARYASSLLLLLAVLGTFAGVKTALPGLIDAVSKTGAGRAGTGDITAPLRSVADAFGGNALALVGAIAVGLMAQGLSTGRRNLLERLELVSTEFLYGTLQGGSVDPLTEAVRELTVTSESVRQAGTAIAGVEDAIVALGATFDGAFERLNEQLVEVAERQDEALHERTSRDVRELQRRVMDLAAVVEQNTRGYQGIVDTVDERARESRAAIDLVRQSAGSLQQALQSVAEVHAGAQRTAERAQQTLQGFQAGVQQTLEGLGTGVRQALGALVEGSDTAAGRMEAVAAAVERAQPAIDTVEVLLRTVSEQVSTIDQRASAAWSAAATQVNASLAEVLREARSPNGRGHVEPVPPAASAAPAAPAAAARDPEVTALLRRVAAAVESQGEVSSRARGFAQGAGAVAALAVGYGGFLVAQAVVAWLGW